MMVMNEWICDGAATCENCVHRHRASDREIERNSGRGMERNE